MPPAQERGISLARIASNRYAMIAGGILSIGLLASPLVAFKRVKISEGKEMVIIDKPYLFGDGGVRKMPLTTGAEWIWSSTDNVVVDMIPEQHTENFDDIITSDNVPVDFSAYIKIKILSRKSPIVIENFGKDWYKNNVQQKFCKELRDEVAKYPMPILTTRQDAASAGTGMKSDLIDSIERKVKKIMEDFVKEKGIPVEIQEVIIGKITPPDRIKEQLAETAAQQQRKKTEREKVGAEEERRLSELKRAAADNAYKQALGLNTTEFIETERFKNNKEVASILAGSKGAVTVILTQGSTVQPVLNVDRHGTTDQKK